MAHGAGCHTSHFEVKSNESAELTDWRSSARGGKVMVSTIAATCSGWARKSMKPGQSASMTGASPPISTSQSAFIEFAGHELKIADYRGLCPMNLVAGIMGE